mmetsp:Transcript_80035/g.179090  ORF Transcript_80035/g.179090 Transcript_80035/m.179090 type:complete len:209 (+) Transcript_80035:228-854(+)
MNLLSWLPSSLKRRCPPMWKSSVSTAKASGTVRPRAARAQQGLDRVDVHPSLVVELDTVVAELAVNDFRFVDLHGLGQLAVSLQIPGLICCVLNDDVALLVLEVAQGHEHDVALVDPDLLPHLATDVAQALGAIEARDLATAVAKHAHDLAVLLPILLELELFLGLGCVALGSLGLVATKLVLRHLCGRSGEGSACWWNLRKVPRDLI